MKSIVVILALISTNAFAGGLGSILINAAEIDQGRQQAERQQRGQLPQQQPLQPQMPPRIECGPIDGLPGAKVQFCTATFADGSRRDFSCMYDGQGSVNCQ